MHFIAVLQSFVIFLSDVSEIIFIAFYFHEEVQGQCTLAVFNLAGAGLECNFPTPGGASK